MKIIFDDKKEKILMRVENERVMEVIFYDSLLHNIYRGKIENKIDSLKAYFVKISENESLFLKSTLAYNIGDNVIIQYVREPANGKLGLASENFSLENEAYTLTRYPLKKRPRLKKGKDKDETLYKEILAEKERLINEEKFFPSPKLLVENSSRDFYLASYRDYKIRDFDVRNSREFSNLKEELKKSELGYKDLSIIIDELKTLTVIDVNTAKRKSKLNKKDFLLNVNLELIDFIVYNLKLRNIGGMVVIDFLRTDGKEELREAFEDAARKYKLEAEVFGFSQMGLFEISIKRRGDSLKAKLEKRNLLF
ncbi:ribonuclease, Rne/Rng family [Anaerococcus lactolyticus ATCC 51172]|uniref:Ribonuclease, Rne/Rng family n=1 Tax=Anaerococcus lactolyticus ATCC 51172 TaxID=525254 RepID=C2BCG2_9FIRM|nr:ribonuclease E/G [Anaerococcus lactolyticus]EEI87364.1 ribonuclease, Rne/Rng family [Anaerococcus lactolyticus ATCC 51172]